MSLHVSARVARRGFDVTLDVDDGEHLAVLGPNGAGKSTLLHLLAGTLRPDAGVATLGDRTLFERHEAHRPRRGGPPVWIPPHRRGVALLAQDPLLFPHLGVLDNVAFAPRAQGVRVREARARAERWLDEVGALELAGRRPHELSGGQAQRVAVARALAAEPRLLLLDEPMAALDVAVAPTLRRVLRRVLAGRTTLLVTHDLLDALLLSERVAVLEGGRLVESGPTEDALSHPRSRFSARLAGLNLVRGSWDGHGVTTDALRVDGTRRDGDTLTGGEPAAAAFAPSDVAIYLDAPLGSPRNAWPVRMTEIEPRGSLVRVRAEAGGHVLAADVTPASVRELDLHPGRDVVFSVKSAAVTVYPI